MRLTGGDAGGRRLKGPKGSEIRPTSDRVREALFDIIGQDLSGLRFLDAYAGSGAVGIEALSRGAGHVVFLENNSRATRLIRANLQISIWSGSHEILEGDVGRSLPRLARRQPGFDYAYLDPPYDKQVRRGTLVRLAKVMAPEGRVIVEHRVSSVFEALEGAPLSPGRTYRYGDTCLTVLIRGGMGETR